MLNNDSVEILLDATAEGVQPRVVIAGVPRSGKTILADQLTDMGEVQHTDDLIGHLEWSAASAAVARWFDEAGPWVIEGVATIRALRKWFRAHPAGLPCDLLLWLPTPCVPLTQGQRRMAKACDTVYREVQPQLLSRGASCEDLGSSLLWRMERLEG